MYTLIENRGYEQYIVLDGTMDECLCLKEDLESIPEEVENGVLCYYIEEQ